MRIATVSCVAVLMGLGGPAFGQSGSDSINAKFKNWSGFWGGVQAGGSYTQFGNNLSDGSQFCVANTSGEGASARCAAGSDFAYAGAVASLPGAISAAAAHSALDGGDAASGTNSGSDSAWPGPTGIAPDISDVTLFTDPPFAHWSGSGAGSSAGPSGGPTLHFADARANAGATTLGTDRFFARAVASATDSTGSSSAGAIALANILDFGSGDFSDGKSPAFGGHFHYDHQFMNNFILGVGADFLILPNNEVQKSFSDAEDYTISGGSSSFLNISASGTQHIDIDAYALASARVRAGHAMGNMMSYVTGGIAKGDFQARLEKTATLSLNGVGPDTFRSIQRESITAVGGVVGGGLSMWLGERTALSFETLYYIFNEEISFSSSETVELENIATATIKISYKLK